MRIAQSKPIVNGFFVTSTTSAGKPILGLALVFLFKHVFDIQLEESMTPARSNRVVRPPTVMTQSGLQRLLAAMEGKPALMATPMSNHGNIYSCDVPGYTQPAKPSRLIVQTRLGVRREKRRS